VIISYETVQLASPRLLAAPRTLAG
jgi:hypothetical protein